MDRLGKKIKELRKKTDLTQEQLAERLGVSFQAVSKWETGTALPDISMLPVLANFFNVTTDELLGVDLSKKQEKIDEILSEYTRLKNLGKENKSFDFIRKAYYEYPNDYRIMEKYIFGLYYNAPNNFDENGNYVPLANEDELFYLCNRILDECPLDSVHYSALSMLSSLYSDKGDTEKALEYNNRFPTYGYSQEEELEEIYDRESDKWFEVVRSNINQLTYMLVIKIRNIALYTIITTG